MSTESVFKNLASVDENSNMLAFQLTPTNVAYANTLRRMVLTGVESVAFNSTMNEKGESTDVAVKENTTPMTNEMLADRIGLIPIHADPASWNPKEYYFELKIENDTDMTKAVAASDFEIRKRGAIRKQQQGGAEENESNQNQEDVVQEENTLVANKEFFHPDPKTGDTCLIALLKAKQPNQAGQKIHLVAQATVGTGRDHIRYSPVSQCSYHYTIDTDDQKQQRQFEKWIETYKNKKVSELDEEAKKVLMREFQTMEVQRCYKVDPKTGEPNSFEFVIESVGVQTVDKIVERALRNTQNRCLKYANIDREPPTTVRIQHADARMKGFDFIFQKEDHTLGNLLQTYMDEKMMGIDISFVGYKVPHPLRDEMVLRVGVDFPTDKERDGLEITAKEAVAKAAKACADMFGKWLNDWLSTTSQGRGRRSLASLRPTATTQREVENSANLARQIAEREQQQAVKGGSKRMAIKA